MSKAKETRIAKILLSKGVVTQAQLEECLAIRKEMIGMGIKSKPLLEILVEKTYVSSAQAHALEQALEEDQGLKEIPGYEILGTIGSGSMGTVYKGYQKSMEREVAIKVLKPALARNSDYVERFLTEARMAAKVKHSNIISGIDVGEVGGQYYLVMEYFPNRPVNTFIYESGRMDVRVVVDIALQIADALQHAHLNGLVHRDIKPENILLDEEGTAKLCDMGLAKVVDRSGEGREETVGTPLYISPELVEGRSDVDIRSDIYSLGASLYHMVLGRAPFLASSTTSIMKMHVKETVVPPAKRDPSVPGDLSRVIVRMLQKDPQDRYQTPADLVNDLRALLDTLPAPEKETKEAPPARPVAVVPPMVEEEAQAPPPQEAAEPKKGEPKKKGKKRRTRKASHAPLYIVGGVLAVIIVVVGISLSGSPPPENGKPDKPDKPDKPTGPDKPGPGEDTPAVPSPEDAEKASRRLLDDAIKYYKEHPDGLAQAMERFKKVASRKPETKAVVEAATWVTTVRKAVAARVATAFQDLKSQVAALLAEKTGLDRALKLVAAFQEKVKGKHTDAELEATREKEKVEREIGRLWAAEEKKADGFAKLKDFDAAAKTVSHAISDRGIATAATIQRVTGTDPGALAAAYRRKALDLARDAALGADERYKAFMANLTLLFDRGKTADGKTCPPFDRYILGLALAEKRLADPLYRPKAAAIAPWRDAMARAARFARCVGDGLSRRASRKGRLSLLGEEKKRVLSELRGEGKARTVVFKTPSQTLPLADVVRRLSHETIYDLAIEGLGGSRMGGDDHLAAAVFLALTPPGSVSEAVERVQSHLGRAGRTSVGPPDKLDELLARHEEASGEVEASQELAKLKTASARCKDTRSAARLLPRWRRFLDRFGNSATAKKDEAAIKAEMERLDTLAHPPQPVNVAGLAVKARAFEKKSGAITMEYGFSERGALRDWVLRRFDFGADVWADYVIDNFIGKRIDVKLGGGGLSASGGGFVFWKPRLVGDFTLSVDLYPIGAWNQLILVHMSDNGGYSFANRLSTSALAGWAASNNVNMDAASGTGLFKAYPAWTPSFPSLQSGGSYRLAPKRWYTVRIARTGKSIRVDVGPAGRKVEKTYEATDEKHAEGRFGLCLMKSSAVLDNFKFKGTVSLTWLENTSSGVSDYADLPGEEQ